MNVENTFGADQQTKYMANYLDALSSVERLHRLLLDVIKDEFERLGHLELNAVQALLLFNIGDNEMTCLLYTSPSPRDATLSRMPSSA